MEADSAAAIDRYKPRGVTRVIRALGSSIKGLAGAFRDEAAFRQELALAVLVIPLGLWLGHSGVERALLIGPVLLTLIVELINSAIGTTLTVGKHLDADTEARMVLDRMAYDASKLVKRSDVDYYFQKNPSPGSDQMAFYSESSGYFTGVSSPTTQGSTISLVGYRINSTTLQLERLSKGLVWNGVAAPSGSSPMVFLPNQRQLGQISYVRKIGVTYCCVSIESEHGIYGFR